MSGTPSSDLVHASCVALAGRGLLILGPSGSGKSTLALQLMGLGAALVADDQVALRRDGDQVLAEAPARLRGMIEARGVGLLRAEAVGPVPLALAVDLAVAEHDRLPSHRQITLLGWPIPLVLGHGAHHLSFALLQYLKGGRQA